MGSIAAFKSLWMLFELDLGYSLTANKPWLVSNYSEKIINALGQFFSYLNLSL